MKLLVIGLSLLFLTSCADGLYQYRCHLEGDGTMICIGPQDQVAVYKAITPILTPTPYPPNPPDNVPHGLDP